MKKPKVLMLGWELPPLISGGLGIACQGMASALSSLVDLTLVLPRLEEGASVPGARLIGLGNIELEEIIEKEDIQEFEKVIIDRKIRISISPYPETTTITGDAGIRKKKIQRPTRRQEVRKVHEGFSKTDLYGADVTEKVRYYTEIIERLAARLDFDLIHAHDWMTFQAGIRLRKKYGKPLVLHVHSLNFDRIGPVREGWVYELEREALQTADLILPVSHYTGSVIREHYGVGGDRIFPVHNGIDPVKVFRTEKRFPEKLVLFLGRITLQKGPEFFLETANRVIGKYPDVRFAIAGTGDLLHHMIEDGAYREISHKLHFTGFIDREKVHSLLSMADVFCMPSLSEPFGLTALEAVQFGVPVVITRRSGAAEVLPSALLADFWDTEQMASHIIRLLSDEAYHARLAREGKKELKKVTWEASAARILEGYKKLLPA